MGYGAVGLGELAAELREFVEAFDRLSSSMVRAYYARVALIYFAWAIWIMIISILMSLPVFGLCWPSSPYKIAFFLAYWFTGLYLINIRSWPRNISVVLAKSDKRELRKANIVAVLAWIIGGALYPLPFYYVHSPGAWTIGFLILLGLGNTGVLYAIRALGTRGLIIDALLVSIFFIGALGEYFLIMIGLGIAGESFLALSLAATAYLGLGMVNLLRALR